MAVAGYAFIKGDYKRFTNGVDFNCDTCNATNPILPGIENSGRDLRGRAFLIQLRSSDAAFIDVPSVRECRAVCPIEL